MQWAWFLTPVSSSRIGRGFGPLTWSRALATRFGKRPVNIVLLEHKSSGRRFAPMTAWAINRNSTMCRASVNGDLSRADVIWVYSQDPLLPAQVTELARRIACESRPHTPIINRPTRYNGYHALGAFARLAKAGVDVPRHHFGPDDVGRTEVVYKQVGVQAAAKEKRFYDGDRPGWCAFEFVESANATGERRRYRAHYVLGMVRPSEAFVSSSWNVCGITANSIDYQFKLTDYEINQIQLIAATLDLQYFAVDFVRRSDGTAVFLDINVYPTIRSPRHLVRNRGDFGVWHTFDARARLGHVEPNGAPVWEAFDKAVVTYARKGRGRLLRSDRRSSSARMPAA